ncbi:hypothetical protein ACJJTC_016950 [Scirpophaga incertulas]
MALIIFLTLSCLALLQGARSQAGYSNILNPDRIYFNDEGQRYPGVLPISIKHDSLGTNGKSSNAQTIEESSSTVQTKHAAPKNNVDITQSNEISPVPQNINQYNPDISLAPLNDKVESNPISQINNVLANTIPQTNFANPFFPLFNPIPQNIFANNPVFQNIFGNIPPVPLFNSFGNTLNSNFPPSFPPNSFVQNRTPQNDNFVNGVQIPPSDAVYNQPIRSNRFNVDRSQDAFAVKNATVPQAPINAVSLSITDFGIKLMKIMQRQQGNLVVSPFSIATLLALLHQGSLGITQQQITEALQLTPYQSADGFKRLVQNMRKRASHNILNVANGIFVAPGFNLNPAYMRTARNDFLSEVDSLMLTRPAAAAQKINKWVSKNTNNKIDKVIVPDALTADTQLVLVNAVYFKGLWAIKFRPESTTTGDFYLSNGGKKAATFMRMRRQFKADIDQDIASQILVLPFEGGQYSLVTILPTEGASIPAVMASLTKEKLLAYQSMTSREVAIEIPKFTVKSDSDLGIVLQQLGVTNIFGPRSDLSGIGKLNDYSPRVSSASHSAMFSIDEQGGVAAGASTFGAVALSYDDPSLLFKANRPFITVLWDNEASIPLFIAKIEDPIS